MYSVVKRYTYKCRLGNESGSATVCKAQVATAGFPDIRALETFRTLFIAITG